MSQEVRLGVSELTGRVYAGSIEKGVRKSPSYDVTGDFFRCVVETFAPEKGKESKTSTVCSADGGEEFEVVVRRKAVTA